MTEKPQYTGKMLDELFAKVDEALEAGSDGARTVAGEKLCGHKIVAECECLDEIRENERMHDEK
jgi:hypothetical protein